MCVASVCASYLRLAIVATEGHGRNDAPFAVRMKTNNSEVDKTDEISSVRESESPP